MARGGACEKSTGQEDGMEEDVGRARVDNAAFSDT